MRKIPVGETIARSYGFVFRNYFSILGLAWLPLAIMFAASAVIMRPLYRDWLKDFPNAAPGVPPLAFARGFPLMLLFNLFFWALIIVILVGVAREAMGIRRGWRFAYLRFGIARREGSF